MKMPRFLPVLAACVAGIAAGSGVTFLLHRTAGGMANETDRRSAPRLAGLTVHAQAGAGAAVSDEAKADARAAADSPRAFLASLTGLSPLKARSRIDAALADMPLELVREVALKTSGLGMSMNNNPAGLAMMGAACDRWAELDPEDLLTTARQATGSTRSLMYAGIGSALRELTSRDPDSAWKRAQDLGQSTWYARQAVLNAIGETDPEKAFKLTLKNSSSQQDSYTARSFMQGWLARDPKAAIAAFESLPAGEFRSGLTQGLAQTYAATNPEAALAWSRSLVNPADRSAALQQVLGELASKDPQQALALADRPEFAAQRREVVTAAVTSWAKKDFDAAFAWTMGMKSPADQQEIFRTLSNDLTAAQRDKLIEAAGTLPPQAAKAIYQSALGYANMQGGDAARDLINKVTSPSIREELLKSMVDGYGGSIENRLENFDKLQSSSKSASQVTNLASQLAWTDPERAFKWAQGLDSPDLQKSGLTAALSSWAQNDPAAASVKAASLTDPAQREAAMRTVAAGWAGRDENAALAWADGLTGKDRSAALGALVQNLQTANPAQAQQVFQRFTAALDPEAAGSAENKSVARALASTLTENNPQQAITWVQGLPAGGLRDEALAGIAAKWAGYDPMATSQWIGALPAGEGRDLAAGQLVTAIAQDDPDSAWIWATSITDPDRRREAAAAALQSWKARGAKDAARAALGSADFTDDEVRGLSKKLD